MLLFGKNPLDRCQRNSSWNSSDRPIFNWFKDIGVRELFLLLIYAVGLTTVIYLTRYHAQTSSVSASVVKQDASLADLEFSGIVNPAKKLKIPTDTAAVVKEIYVDIGDRLQPNQPILKLKSLVDPQKLDRIQQQRFDTDLEIAKTRQQRDNAMQKIMQFQQKISIINRKLSTIDQLFDTELRLSKAESSLKLLQQQQDLVQMAKNKYLRATTQYDRLKKLARQGIVSSKEIERSRADLVVAKTNLASVETGTILQAIEQQQRRQWQLRKQLMLLEQQQQLAATKGQIQLARSQSRQATQSLTLLYQQRSLLAKESDAVSFPVTAKTAGVVVNLPVVVGDRLYAGKSIVELAQLASLKVRVAVSTELISTLRLGQRAFVQLGKGAEAQQIEATVVTINPIPERDLTHAVEVQFQNPQESFLVGQTAKVRFIAEE